MENDVYGLPEIYLSPSRSSRPRGTPISRQQGSGISVSNENTTSDTDQNVWGDTDEESWVPLVAESTTQEDSGVEDRSVSEPLPRDNHLGAPLLSQPSANDSAEALDSLNAINKWSRQRGETPGSDCRPPLVGAVGGSGSVGTPLPVAFRPVTLETNISFGTGSELVFSPGGDEGYMLPSGVCAYYGSDSDVEDSEWNILQVAVTNPGQVPVRDAVEGADSVTPTPGLSYLPGSTSVAPEGLERNSPAGLSTPDAELSLQSNMSSSNNGGIKIKSIRPPVVGQSKEHFGQPIRKDLGSTDGEESEDELPIRRPSASRDQFEIQEAQLASLGSQSENTDSVSTVLDLDMSRGEIQGCETENDDTAGTMQDSPVTCPKPSFVVGGLMNSPGKSSSFRSNNQGRTQDVKASLQNQTVLTRSSLIEREQFMSQPPFYPFVSEQEISLTSILSVESTNHPDSSERVTSPSVLSVSSATSSKRLEWDSGADVGYPGNPPREKQSTSLSTLERIAIGNYASVLRTEPEGTTQVREKRANRKGSKQLSKALDSNKSAIKAGASSSSNSMSYTSQRKFYASDKASAPSRSWRYQQYRTKGNDISSSDEEFNAKARTSPAVSPRRKPRRKIDSPGKGNYVKGRQSNAGQRRKIARELSNEGKSSSLVELNPVSVNVLSRRSSSQQDLAERDMSSFSSQNSGSNSIKMISSTTFTGTGSSTSVATTVYRNILEKSQRAFDSAVSSTNTLVQTDSLLSTSKNSSNENTLEKNNGNRYSRKTTNLKSTYCTDGIPRILKPPDRGSISSINELSSPSQGTSDVDTPSDMKETDGESCPSNQISEDESHININQEHDDDRRIQSKFDSQSRQAWEGIDSSETNTNELSLNQSTSVESSSAKSDPSITAILLEKQSSVEEGNKSLLTLSVRLQKRVTALMEVSSVQKAHDYKKLQDYIEFIGHPSASEEEYGLKHNVAGVIMRMFGEIGIEESDNSTTIHSETSDSLTTTDSQISYHGKNSICSFVSSKQSQETNEDLANQTDKLKKSKKSEYPSEEASPRSMYTEDIDDSSVEEMMERVVTPGGTVNLVPYRPPSATRMYYMNIAQDSAESGVEGGRTASSISTLSTKRIESKNSSKKPSYLFKDSIKNDEAIDQIQSRQMYKKKAEKRTPRGQAMQSWEEKDSMRADVSSILLPPDRIIHHYTDEENSMSQSSYKDHQTLEAAAHDIKELSFHDLESITSSAAQVSGKHVRRSSVRSKHLRLKGNYGTLTSEDSSPRLNPSNGGSPDWQSSEPSATSGSQSLREWQQHPTKKSERLYQDCQGMLHIAHQPPGYAEEPDSHSSESISDQENQRNDEDAEGDQRRVSAAAWSSSVSESAYETIRERHRHVDEALASSFEFYSTSPRDARRLGYVSSEAERDQGGDESSEASVSGLFGAAVSAGALLTRDGSHQIHHHNDASSQRLQGSSNSLRTSASTSRGPSNHRYNQYPNKQLTSVSSNGNSSMEGDRSSQVEFIKKQKQKHMIKIQKHIHTLERLERDLINELGDNPGSERNIRRNVTEGRSNTESDTNKPRFRNILGQSGTATSSVISTELSDDVNSRQPYTNRPDKSSRISLSQRHGDAKMNGRLGRKNQGSSKRHERQLPMAKLLLKKGNATSISTDSQTSTPRLPISHMSSGHPSSEYLSPGISLVENELKHLLAMKDYSKQGIMTSQDFASSNEYPNQPDPRSHGSTISSMHREEPRGEEDPRRKQQTQGKKFTNVIPVAKQLSESSEAISEKSNSRSVRKNSKEVSQRKVIKSNKARDNDIKDLSVSRQGDGREERDGVVKIIPIVQPVNPVGTQKLLSQSKSGYVRKRSSEKAKTSTDDSNRSSRKQRKVPVKDFSQMYPSAESVADIESDTGNEVDRLSVGIQTSASLLCLNENTDELDTSIPRTKTQGIQAVLPMSKNYSLSTHHQQIPTSAIGKEIKTNGIYTNTEHNENVDNMNNLYSYNHNDLQGIRSQDKNQTSQYETAEIANESHVSLNDSERVLSRNQSPSIIQNENYILSQKSKPVINKQNVQQYSLQGETEYNHSHKDLVSHPPSRQDVEHTSRQTNTTHLDYNSKHTNTSHVDHNSMQTNTTYPQIYGIDQPYQHTTYLPYTDQKESNRSEKNISVNNDQIADIQSQANLTSSTVYYEVPPEVPRKPTNYQSQSARQAPISSTRQPITRPQSAREERIYSSQPMMLNLGDGAETKRSHQRHKRPESSRLNKERHSQNQPNRDIITDHSTRAKNCVQNIEETSLEEDTRSEDERLKIPYKQPVRFDVSATQINISESDICSATDNNYADERGTSLQDALLSAHPGYLRSAESRRLQIRMKAALRKQAQEHNHQVLAQVPPNLQTPSTIKRFLYKPEVKPLFTYKDIRNQNARLYQLLPEARVPIIQGKRGAIYRTNRLMANMYSTRLRKKVLAGKTDHAHHEVITPVATRRR